MATSFSHPWSSEDLEDILPEIDPVVAQLFGLNLVNNELEGNPQYQEFRRFGEHPANICYMWLSFWSNMRSLVLGLETRHQRHSYADPSPTSDEAPDEVSPRRYDVSDDFDPEDPSQDDLDIALDCANLVLCLAQASAEEQFRSFFSAVTENEEIPRPTLSFDSRMCPPVASATKWKLDVIERCQCVNLFEDSQFMMDERGQKVIVERFLGLLGIYVEDYQEALLLSPEDVPAAQSDLDDFIADYDPHEMCHRAAQLMRLDAHRALDLLRLEPFVAVVENDKKPITIAAFELQGVPLRHMWEYFRMMAFQYKNMHTSPGESYMFICPECQSLYGDIAEVLFQLALLQCPSQHPLSVVLVDNLAQAIMTGERGDSQLALDMYDLALQAYPPDHYGRSLLLYGFADTLAPISQGSLDLHTLEKVVELFESGSEALAAHIQSDHPFLRYMTMANHCRGTADYFTCNIHKFWEKGAIRSIAAAEHQTRVHRVYFSLAAEYQKLGLPVQAQKAKRVANILMVEACQNLSTNSAVEEQLDVWRKDLEADRLGEGLEMSQYHRLCGLHRRLDDASGKERTRLLCDIARMHCYLQTRSPEDLQKIMLMLFEYSYHRTRDHVDLSLWIATSRSFLNQREGEMDQEGVKGHLHRLAYALTQRRTVWDDAEDIHGLISVVDKLSEVEDSDSDFVQLHGCFRAGLLLDLYWTTQDPTHVDEAVELVFNEVLTSENLLPDTCDMFLSVILAKLVSGTPGHDEVLKDARDILSNIPYASNEHVDALRSRLSELIRSDRELGMLGDFRDGLSSVRMNNVQCRHRLFYEAMRAEAAWASHQILWHGPDSVEAGTAISGPSFFLSTVDIIKTRQFEDVEADDSLSDTINALKDISDRANIRAPVRHRFFACLLLINIGEQYEMTILAMDAYRAAVYLLPQISYLAMNVSSRVDQLKRWASGIAADAALYALSLGQAEEAVELVEHGRAIFWAQVSSMKENPKDLPPQLGHEYRQIVDRIEGASSMDDRSVYVDELDHFLMRVRRMPGHERFLLPAPYRELSQAASEGPVAILAISSRHASRDYTTELPDDKNPAHAVLVLPSPGDPPMHLFQPKDHSGFDIGDAVVSWKETLEEILTMRQADYSIHQEHLDLLEILGTEIVQPILTMLDFYPKSVKDEQPPRMWWYISGSYSASSLPLHAAILDDSSLACDYAVMSYIPSLSWVIQARAYHQETSSKQHMEILAIGQSDSQVDGWTPLRYVSEELKAIEKILPSKALIRMSPSSQESILSANLNRDCATVLRYLSNADVVHISGHAFQDHEHPLESGFLMHDRVLAMATLIQHLRAHERRRRIAILNCCEAATGMDNLPDEVLHLAGTMATCGFESVVAFLWSLNDKDAPEIASAIYTEFSQSFPELPTTDRVPRALAKLLNKFRNNMSAPPWRWASCIHIGI